MLITSLCILSMLARSQADPVMCHTVRATFLGPALSTRDLDDCDARCYTSAVLLHSWLATEGRDACFPSESDICLSYGGHLARSLGPDPRAIEAVLRGQPMKARFDKLGLEGSSAWDAQWINSEEQMPTAIAYFAQVNRFSNTYKRFFWAASKKLPELPQKCICMVTLTFQSVFISHPPHLTRLSCALDILRVRLQTANWHVTLIDSLGGEFVCLNAPELECRCGGRAEPFCKFNYLHRGGSGGKGKGKVSWG